MSYNKLHKMPDLIARQLAGVAGAVGHAKGRPRFRNIRQRGLQHIGALKRQHAVGVAHARSHAAPPAKRQVCAWVGEAAGCPRLGCARC